MVFNSIEYLIFFPIIILIYYIVPFKYRCVWLLIASYYFYLTWSPRFLVIIFAVTLVTYWGGIILSNTKKISDLPDGNIKSKLCLVTMIVINLGILCVYKYTEFFLSNIAKVMSFINMECKMPKVDIVVPLGISYFIFQVIGYILDVYRGETEAEKNFIKYALFVSFFPKLISGPIERSKNLILQFNCRSYFNEKQVKRGLITMGYGLFLKLVVAENIATVISPVFADVREYRGMAIMMACVLFAFQLYCDFQGYSLLAIGSARILGIELIHNFDAPYWAQSVREFWQRWHISLTTWFRDYLYIPLGGNRKGEVRKQINTLVVFFLSGLWHGAGWKYLFWGGLNGLYIVLQDICKKYNIGLRSGKTSFFSRSLKRIITFILIDIAWVLFAANSLRDAIFMFKMMVLNFKIECGFLDELLILFGTRNKFFITILFLVLVMLLDYMQYRKIDLIEVLFGQRRMVRWAIYLGLLLSIVLWGNYGGEYEQTQFIYFQF